MPGVTAVHWTPFGPDRVELKGAGAAVRQIQGQAGQVVPRHEHPFEQFVFVISGQGRLECEAGVIPLEPGTALHLEPGAWHSAAFAADTVLLEVNLAETTRS
jgi:quercetin dioxygenase-like cupin family protein